MQVLERIEHKLVQQIRSFELKNWYWSASWAGGCANSIRKPGSTSTIKFVSSVPGSRNRGRLVPYYRLGRLLRRPWHELWIRRSRAQSSNWGQARAL